MKGITCSKAYLGISVVLVIFVILVTSCSGGTTTTTEGEFSVTTIPPAELTTSSTTSAVTPYAGSHWPDLLPHILSDRVTVLYAIPG